MTVTDLSRQYELDASISHWGEAAFAFSLDLSYDLQMLLFGDSWNPLSITYACRSAIGHGRKHFELNDEAQLLRGPIQRALAGAPESHRFVDFIETQMVSRARFENRTFPYSDTLYDEDANSSATRHMRDHLKSGSFREDVFAALDNDYYKTLFDIALEIDRELNFGLLSDWDAEIIERNSLSFTDEDPLQNLLHSADLTGRRKAIDQVLASVPVESRPENGAQARV